MLTVDFCGNDLVVFKFSDSQCQKSSKRISSIIGLVVEFIVAIDEARVRFTDDARNVSFFL